MEHFQVKHTSLFSLIFWPLQEPSGYPPAPTKYGTGVGGLERIMGSYVYRLRVFSGVWGVKTYARDPTRCCIWCVRLSHRGSWPSTTFLGWLFNCLWRSTILVSPLKVLPLPSHSRRWELLCMATERPWFYIWLSIAWNLSLAVLALSVGINGT